MSVIVIVELFDVLTIPKLFTVELNAWTVPSPTKNAAVFELIEIINSCCGCL